MTVVGLLGPAGAGKSTVAEYLAKYYGAQRYSFASPLKTFAKNALEFTDEQLYGTQAQKESPDERYGGKSARWFLQRLGTEGARKTFGNDFWVNRLLDQIQHEHPTLAVIEDVRFVNEAALVGAEVGRHIWRLECPSRETIADVTHPSESEWTRAHYDYRIAPAKRGLEHLFDLVDEACAQFGIALLEEVA